MNQSKLLNRISYYATSTNVNQVINILDQIISDLQIELTTLDNSSLYIGNDVNLFPTTNISVNRLGIDTTTRKIYSFNGSTWNQVVEPCQSPMNVINPIISGTINVGDTLTVTNNGTWIGDSPITYTYQWLRNGADIGGEVNSTYLLTALDVGTNISCRVTGTNACGFANATSNALGPIVGSALLDTYATNTAYGWSVARKLKSSATVAIRIRRSNDNAESDIGFDVYGNLNTNAITTFVGANSAFITRIYEQNASGYTLAQTTAGSQPRIVNAGVLEVLNTKPCGVRGAANVSMSVASSTSYFNFLHDGTNSSAFHVFSFGNTFSNRFYSTRQGSGAGIDCYFFSAQNPYTVIANASGVIATNTPSLTLTSGQQYFFANYFDADNATAANRLEFYLNGRTAQKNNITTGTPSTGNASTDFNFSYNDSNTKFQELILFPSQPTLSTIRNNINTYYNIYTAPINTVAPTISGGTTVGYLLSSTTGTWNDGNNPPITYSYQWKRNGSNIVGATSSTYSIATADLGANITCMVTATNSWGSNSANSSNSIVPNSSATLLDSYATNTAYGWSVASKLKNTATNAIRVRRSNDNAETDIGFVNNVLDTATLLSFVGANSAFITKIYEQVGSGYDLIQTSAGYQPRIVNAGVLDIIVNRIAAVSTNNNTQMYIPSSESYFKFLHNGTSSSAFGVFSTGGTYGYGFTTHYTDINTGFDLKIQGGTNYLNTVGNVNTQVVYNRSTINIYTTPAVISCYVDADNAVAADRSELYVNGGVATKANTHLNAPNTGNSEAPAYIFGKQFGSPIPNWQEIIVLPSQPTLSTFRTDINSRYRIY